MLPEPALAAAIRSAIRPLVYESGFPASNVRLIVADAEGNALGVRDFPLSLPADGSTPGTLPGLPDVYASPDFRSVRWLGSWFQFTRTQASIVRVLWEARRAGRLAVPHREIVEVVDCYPRLKKVFSPDGVTHPAWGVMVVGRGSGDYRLNVDGREGGR